MDVLLLRHNWPHPCSLWYIWKSLPSMLSFKAMVTLVRASLCPAFCRLTVSGLNRHDNGNTDLAALSWIILRPTPNNNHDLQSAPASISAVQVTTYPSYRKQQQQAQHAIAWIYRFQQQQWPEWPVLPQLGDTGRKVPATRSSSASTSAVWEKQQKVQSQAVVGSLVEHWYQVTQPTWI